MTTKTTKKEMIEMAAIFYAEAEGPSEQDFHDLFRALVHRDADALIALLDEHGLDPVT